MTDLPDAIVKEIVIAAPRSRVWQLISRPGWWLGDTPEELTAPPTDRVEHYPIEIVELRPEDYGAFRWASQFGGMPLADGRCTLIEFVLSPTADGTHVRVTESGFAALVAPEDVVQEGLADNTSGWEHEFDLLRRRIESNCAARPSA